MSKDRPIDRQFLVKAAMPLDETETAGELAMSAIQEVNADHRTSRAFDFGNTVNRNGERLSLALIAAPQHVIDEIVNRLEGAPN